MSTRIHGGYRIRREHIAGFVPAANQALVAVYAGLYRTMLIDVANHTLRQAEADGVLTEHRSAGHRRVRLHVEQFVAHRVSQAQASPTHDLFDFSCAYTAILPTDPNDPWVYLLLFPQAHDYTPVWEALPHVEEFAYWDNVDRPDHLTDIQWGERRDIWGSVLGSRAPAEVGLSFNVADVRGWHRHLTSDLLDRLAYDPSYANRWIPDGWLPTRR